MSVEPPLFGEVLASRLAAEPSIAVVARSRRESASFASLSKLRPDVLVLGSERAGSGLAELVTRLRSASPATRILLMTPGASEDTAERLLRAGASGLVADGVEIPILIRALHAVAAGELWANRRVTSAALDHLTGDGGAAPKPRLTPRERQIAAACGRGLRNREIASRLNIQPKTVKGHLSNIFRKLEVENRFALVRRVSASAASWED